jgi:hypothetical protein
MSTAADPNFKSVPPVIPPVQGAEFTQGQDPEPSEGNRLEGYFALITKLDINAEVPPIIRAPADGRVISSFAKELGKILREQNFFLYDGKCTRIELDKKLSVHRISEIEPQQFRSLIERYCYICVIKIIEEGGRKNSFHVQAVYINR